MIKAIEGEESPMQQYVYELKQYKETHTERYKQIEQTNEGWEIAQATNGTAYFIVKAPRSAKLAINIHTAEDSQSKAQIISLLELLEAMRVDESAQRIALPDNWQQLSADAIKTYNQYFCPHQQVKSW